MADRYYATGRRKEVTARLDQPRTGNISATAVPQTNISCVLFCA